MSNPPGSSRPPGSDGHHSRHDQQATDPYTRSFALQNEERRDAPSLTRGHAGHAVPPVTHPAPYRENGLDPALNNSINGEYGRRYSPDPNLISYDTLQQRPAFQTPNYTSDRPLQLFHSTYSHLSSYTRPDSIPPMSYPIGYHHSLFNAPNGYFSAPNFSGLPDSRPETNNNAIPPFQESIPPHIPDNPHFPYTRQQSPSFVASPAPVLLSSSRENSSPPAPPTSLHAGTSSNSSTRQNSFTRNPSVNAPQASQVSPSTLTNNLGSRHSTLVQHLHTNSFGARYSPYNYTARPPPPFLGYPSPTLPNQDPREAGYFHPEDVRHNYACYYPQYYHPGIAVPRRPALHPSFQSTSPIPLANDRQTRQPRHTRQKHQFQSSKHSALERYPHPHRTHSEPQVIAENSVVQKICEDAQVPNPLPPCSLLVIWDGALNRAINPDSQEARYLAEHSGNLAIYFPPGKHCMVSDKHGYDAFPWSSGKGANDWLRQQAEQCICTRFRFWQNTVRRDPDNPEKPGQTYRDCKHPSVIRDHVSTCAQRGDNDPLATLCRLERTSDGPHKKKTETQTNAQTRNMNSSHNRNTNNIGSGSSATTSNAVASTSNYHGTLYLNGHPNTTTNESLNQNENAQEEEKEPSGDWNHYDDDDDDDDDIYEY